MKDVGNHVKTKIINFLVEKYCYVFNLNTFIFAA